MAPANLTAFTGDPGYGTKCHLSQSPVTGSVGGSSLSCHQHSTAPLESKTKRQGRFSCHPLSISALPQILQWLAPYLGRTLKGEVALALRESCSISFSRCHEIHLATKIGISSENREPQGESWPTPGHGIQAEQTAAVKTLSYKFLWQNQLA